MSYLVVSIKLSVNYDNESYNDENYNKKENTINTYTKRGLKRNIPNQFVICLRFYIPIILIYFICFAGGLHTHIVKYVVLL